VLLDEFIQVIEDFSLPFGERKHWSALLSCTDYMQKKGEGQ